MSFAWSNGRRPLFHADLTILAKLASALARSRLRPAYGMVGLRACRTLGRSACAMPNLRGAWGG